jgi:PAS domain S-box-containing protein
MPGYDSPQALIDSMTNVAEQLYVNPGDRGKLKMKLTKIGFWILDHQDKNMLHWSEGMTDIFGFHRDSSDSPSSIINTDMIHPDDCFSVVENHEVFMVSGEAFDIEYRIRRQDGVEKWVHEMGHGVDWQNGLCLRSIGAVQDITEQKENEKARAESEQRLQLTIGAVSAGGRD